MTIGVERGMSRALCHLHREKMANLATPLERHQLALRGGHLLQRRERRPLRLQLQLRRSLEVHQRARSGRRLLVPRSHRVGAPLIARRSLHKRTRRR
uniref:Uncharacterized protein n=1 Tax=Karlodinium veneficum TaxID=407301 RepID=E8Z731_KARVE|nr:unknown [Karlodinium veneficum]